MRYRSRPYHKLSHENLESQEKFPATLMSYVLRLQCLPKFVEHGVELSGLYDWPRDNLEFSTMKTTDKVFALLALNDSLKKYTSR